MRRTVVAVAAFALIGMGGFALLLDGAPATTATDADLVLVTSPADPGTAILPAAASSLVIRSREIELQPEHLNRLAADEGLRTIALNLFDDVRVVIDIANRNRAVRGAPAGIRTLSGTVAGDRSSAAVLSVRGGRIDVLISTGNRLFRITPAGDGRHRVAELNRESPPPVQN